LCSFARQRQSVVKEQLAEDNAAWTLAPDSVVNFVSGEAFLVPGALAQVSVRLPLPAPVFAAARPLPKSLAGFALETAAGPADLLSVGPQGAVFLVPDSLRPGPAPLRLTQGAGLSNWLIVMVKPAGGGVAGLLHANGDPVTAIAPAAASETIAAFGTGLWTSALDQPAARLAVFVSGQPAQLVWAGPAPGWIGLQQVNFVVPPLPAAEALVRFVFDGETAGTAPLAIR
jgi:uncharacterized protein (TIGR03437 family)